MLRGGERPAPAFWLFSLVGGSRLVAGFALARGGDGASLPGDLLMVAAILLCGLGYAEGAALSRRHRGLAGHLLGPGPRRSPPWRPVALGDLAARPGTAHRACRPGRGLAYVSVFSMLVGFVFWYRGLAWAALAGVGQLQFLQPFFGLVLAGLVLHEPVAPSMVGVTGAGGALCRWCEAVRRPVKRSGGMGCACPKDVIGGRLTCLALPCYSGASAASPE